MYGYGYGQGHVHSYGYGYGYADGPMDVHIGLDTMVNELVDRESCLHTILTQKKLKQKKKCRKNERFNVVSLW